MDFVMMVGETHRNASGNALWESSKASRATTDTRVQKVSCEKFQFDGKPLLH